jgi:hypothetical protein
MMPSPAPPIFIEKESKSSELVTNGALADVGAILFLSRAIKNARLAPWTRRRALGRAIRSRGGSESGNATLAAIEARLACFLMH